MALVHPGWIIAALLSLLAVALLSYPALTAHALHLHPGDAGYHLLYQLTLHKALAIGIPAVIALLLLGLTAASWSLTYIDLNDVALTYRLGPFAANAIPRGAVQDVSFVKGVGGMIFGYGTLRVFAGREIETIPFVPNVEQIASQLEVRRPA